MEFCDPHQCGSRLNDHGGRKLGIIQGLDMNWLRNMCVRRKDVEDASFLRFHNDILEKHNEELWRILNCSERRESETQRQMDEVSEYLKAVHDAAFPDVDAPESTLETAECIHRFMSAQSREIESLRKSVIENLDMLDCVKRTEELVLEIRERLTEEVAA